MSTKFDILNHDGFLISRGCISVKFWRFRYILAITENLHALKHQCFKTCIQLYLQSLVTQFFPTNPNQNYYVTKLEALYSLEERRGASEGWGGGGGGLERQQKVSCFIN